MFWIFHNQNTLGTLNLYVCADTHTHTCLHIRYNMYKYVYILRTLVYNHESYHCRTNVIVPFIPLINSHHCRADVQLIEQKIIIKFYSQTREMNTIYPIWNPSQMTEEMFWLIYLSNVDVRKAWDLVWEEIHLSFFKISSFLFSSFVLRLIFSWLKVMRNNSFIFP